MRLQLNRANKISDIYFLKVNIASEDGITNVITQPIKFMVIILCTDDQIIIKTKWILNKHSFNIYDNKYLHNSRKDFF